MNPSAFHRVRIAAQRAALLCASLLIFASTACSASFDCAKAGTKVEKMICADPELSKLDETLNSVYSSAVKGSSDSSALKQEQRDWLKIRNNCPDVSCVKKQYRGRTEYLRNVYHREIYAAERMAGLSFSFSLTKGKGVDVCEAYLQRLNTTKFKTIPHCGRPENDAVKGFTKLNRVPLTPEQIYALFGSVWVFSGYANSMRPDSRSESIASFESVKRTIGRGALSAWRFDPPVDIDNDGKPDPDIIVWQGYGYHGADGGGACGQEGIDPGIPTILPSVVFSIDWNQMKINEERTRELSEHPLKFVSWINESTNRLQRSNEFRAIGETMGVFQYRGAFYFDTFFNSWGDFEGKRRDSKVGLRDTLALFLREKGEIRQVCKYRWNEFDEYFHGVKR